jgi:hypothetical protein
MSKDEQPFWQHSPLEKNAFKRIKMGLRLRAIHAD